MKKKIRIILTIAMALAIVSGIAYVITINFLKISYNEQTKANISQAITITRTKDGFPTIFATTKGDLYFALGYCHAKDRLNYMEYQRSIAIGAAEKTIEENSTLLNSLSRIIGFTQKALELKKELSPEQIGLLQRYCDGINFIRKKGKHRQTIERDWFPEDVLAFLMMKEWANAFLNNGELLLQLNKDTTSYKLRNLLKSKSMYYYPKEHSLSIKIIREVKKLVQNSMGNFCEGMALGIPAQLTKDKTNPMEAFIYSDSSLYPNIYPVKINLSNETLSAITMAGMPFFYAFQKSGLTFFSFNLKSDSQRIYSLKKSTENKIQYYETPGGFKPFIYSRIPDFTDSVDISFNLNWETQYGPIMSNLYPNATLNDTIITIRSIFPGKGYIDLFLSTPWKEISKLKSQISKLKSPVRTFLISTENAGYTAISGSYFPRNHKSEVFNRAHGISLLKPQGITKFKRHRGIAYIGSDILDNSIRGSKLASVTQDNIFRIKKLKSLLKKQRIYDVSSVKKIITNSDSPVAEILLPRFLSNLENNPAPSARLTKIYLNSWDMKISPQSIASTIFYSNLFYNIMETFQDKMEEDKKFNFRSISMLVPSYIKIIRNNTDWIFDKTNTEAIETMEDIYDRAFMTSIRNLSRELGPRMGNWKWKSIYKSYFRIPNLDKNILFSFITRKKLCYTGNFDTLYNSSGNYKLQPEIMPSLLGIAQGEKLELQFNFGYSTSILSDYFYRHELFNGIEKINDAKQVAKTVLTPRN